MAAQASGRPFHWQKQALWWPLLIWAALAPGLHYAAPLLNAVNVLGFPLAYYVAAQGALIAFAALGFWAAAPWRRSETHGTLTLLTGLSAAGLWMSGALPVALVGALYAYGYDGLSFALGLSGGFLLVVCIIAPAFSASGTATLTQFLTSRTDRGAAVWAAAMMAVICLILLVSAELEFVRRIAAPLFAGLDGGSDIAVIIAVSLAVVAAACARDFAAIRLQAASYVLILLAVMVVAGVLSSIAFDVAIPQLAYGLGLRNLAALERSLILEGLSDPSRVRPFINPNTSFSAENFLALSLSLMLGTAAMPHLLSRLAAAGPNRAPLHAGAWALLFIALLLMTLPAVAVFTKLDIYAVIANGVTSDSAPAWLKQQRSSVNASLCPQGCADPDGRLHVEDVAMDPEAILPAVPLIARLPGYAAWSFIALLAFAAVFNAGRIIAFMTRTLGEASLNGATSEDLGSRHLGTAVSLAITAGLTAAAAFVTMQLQSDLITRIAWSASLAASGLFPMLLLAALWPRASSQGLAMGGLAGFAVALYYIVGTQVFPLEFLDLWQDYSNMPPWRFEVLDEVRQSCRDAVAGSCGEARDMARELANWWGLDTRAAGVIGAPVGLAVAGLVSLLHAGLARARAAA